MHRSRTRIFHCRRCDIETHHLWAQWKRVPSLFFWRVHIVEGWECSRCGRRVRVRMEG